MIFFLAIVANSCRPGMSPNWQNFVTQYNNFTRSEALERMRAFTEQLSRDQQEKGCDLLSVGRGQ